MSCRLFGFSALLRITTNGSSEDLGIRQKGSNILARSNSMASMFRPYFVFIDEANSFGEKSLRSRYSGHVSFITRPYDVISIYYVVFSIYSSCF